MSEYDTDFEVIPVLPDSATMVLQQFGELVITNAGVIPPAVLPTYNDMVQGERLAFDMTQTSRWVLADIAAMALDYDEFVSVIDHYRDGYINNLAMLARAWPINERWMTLPFSYHIVVTPLRIAGKRARERGDEDEAQWLEHLSHVWMRDALVLGWKRDELAKEYREYTLPPSMRKDVLPEYTETNAEEIVVTNPRPRKYTIAEFRDTVGELLAWASENNAPYDLMFRIATMLGLDEEML